MRRYIIYKNPQSYDYTDERKMRDSYDQSYYGDNMYYDDDRYRYRTQSSPSYHDYEYDYDYEERPYYHTKSSDRYKRSYRRSEPKFVLPNEETADLIMNATAFGEYITKHGYHFTNQLADCASKMLVNANRRDHRWTSEQVRQNLAMQGITDLGDCTIGDITFLANMAYADFYPEVLQSESACIKYAIAVSKDPDGYDGIAFSRWIADLIGKRITTIEWEKYI